MSSDHILRPEFFFITGIVLFLLLSILIRPRCSPDTIMLHVGKMAHFLFVFCNCQCLFCFETLFCDGFRVLFNFTFSLWSQFFFTLIPHLSDLPCKHFKNLLNLQIFKSIWCCLAYQINVFVFGRTLF